MAENLHSIKIEDVKCNELQIGKMLLVEKKSIDHNYSSISDYKDKSKENLKVHITDLPAEIFQHILRYLAFDNISKCRLVSRYFNDMCSALLNSEFNRLRVLVQQRFLAIKAQMPRRESSRRKHPLARESDIIETLYMRLTLLNMTFGKHIERKYCCFFAGEIIDEIYKILQYVENTPSLSRAYKVTDELFDLSTMAMEYFKEHIEPSLPEVTYFASDVFEHPTFSSVKAQHSILEETVAATASDVQHQSSHVTIQNLNKRLKIMHKKVNRNSKEIANLKRTAKVVNQKVNSLGEVINQMKWQQKSCDTTTLPDSHKINEILVQLNLCKHEIELLTAKLSTCSDKKDKTDLESIETNLNNRDLNSFSLIGSHHLNMNASINSSTSKEKFCSSEGNSNKDFLIVNSPSCVPFKTSVKRKLPSCTITSIAEWSDHKRICSVIDDSGIQEDLSSS